MQHKESVYTDAVKYAGAIPVLIPVFSSSEKDMEQLLKRLDGVILTEGMISIPYTMEKTPSRG